MRVSRSLIWAFLVAIAVVVWMVSDNFFGAPADDFAETAGQVVQTDADGADETPNFIVSALRVENQSTELLVRGSGVTEPAFRQPIQTRRSGVVLNVPVVEGVRIQQGDILIELDAGTLPADIAAAQANRDAAAQLYEASEKLVSRNLATDLDLARALASLRNSEATVAQLQEQQSFAVISAPQSGYIEELDVRIGEVVVPNQRIGLLIGLDSLILTVPVPQAEIAQIASGNTARVDIAGFGMFEGEVYRIANESNTATRTFDVEVLVSNASGALKSGMNAEAAIIIGRVPAFAVSPAHLSVTGNGMLSAKVVDVLNHVQLKPVELVKSEDNLAYITGLEDGDILLTTGQAFLTEGEAVSYELEAGAQ